ncbi:MAG: DNA alkylation repair protein [Lachnospiraceae bacterium]|nr:DNA alkylation repair protein [Lachnospiraceae bacterium]
MQIITERLFELQDLSYKQFHSKLMPTIAPEVIIGVRTPALRKLAKELAGTPEAQAFLQELPHQYYEENNLHGFLLEAVREFDTCIAAVNEFLPYVDNWATCDMMSPKVLKKDLPRLYEWVQRWIASGETYTIRFGVNMLMKYYLDEAFSVEYPELVASISSEEYYVKMVVAWYFATALAKQYEVILPYLTEHRLDVWTHNKTIQKAVESYRITAEQKRYLKTLKRKE